MTMSKTSKQPAESISIHLNDFKQLFVQTEFDPFAVHSLFDSSGLDYLVDQMRPRALYQPIHVTLYLPAEKISALSRPVLDSAIRRYCDFKLNEKHNDIQKLRWETLKAFQTGVVFLAACLALSLLSEQATFMADFVRKVLSEGFLIAGWVSIWRPTELLLYEWWPYWRDARIYEKIKSIDFELLPEPIISTA
jgi:hypothetical protein